MVVDDQPEARYPWEGKEKPWRILGAVLLGLALALVPITSAQGIGAVVPSGVVCQS